MVRPADPGGTRREGKPRILFVDDEAHILWAYARLFSRDYEVVLASSGTEALALLQEDPAYDVILCDVRMPNGNGVDLFRAVRESFPGLEKRMSFISGASTIPDDLTCPVLEKPIEPEILREVVAATANS